jgi:hypothetical protein
MCVQPLQLYCAHDCIVEMAKGLVSFVAAFLLLGGTMYLYYRANPTGLGQRHHHAIRRARRRGWLWNVLHWPLAVGLVALSVAFKSLQPYAAKPPPREYVWLLAATLAFVQPIISVQKLCHPGIREYVRAPDRLVRLLLFGCTLALSYAPLVMPAFPASTDGFWYLLFVCATSGASACCVMLEKSPEMEAALWAFIDANEAAANKQRRVARDALSASMALELGDRSSTDLGGKRRHPAAHRLPIRLTLPGHGEALHGLSSLELIPIGFSASRSDAGSHAGEFVEVEAAHKANAW